MADIERKLPRWVTDNLPPELVTSTMFQFDVVLPSNKVIQVNMLADLVVDYEHLETQFEEVPSQYAYWAAVYSEVKQMCALTERKIKVRRGVITQTLSDHARDSGVKATDKQMAQLIEADAMLNKLEEVYARLQKQTGKLYHMVEAIKMKSEVLRSLAGFKRIELDHHR